MQNRIKSWWTHPDRYTKMSGYLALHGAQPALRFVMAVVLLCFGTASAGLSTSPRVVASTADQAVCLAAAVCCLLAAVFWLWRMPSRRGSVVFVIALGLCSAAVLTRMRLPEMGLAIATAFIVLATYVKLAHNARVLVALLVINNIAVGSQIWRIYARGDHLMALGLIPAAVMVFALLPVLIDGLIMTLTSDAVRSGTDPLTSLPNRRGFKFAAMTLARESRNDHTSNLSVVLADLDGFKVVNDRYGHSTGDGVLVDVGEVLQRIDQPNVVVGRLGGEEFVVAVAGPPQQAFRIAEQVRHDIARLSERITASVGVATASLHSLNDGLIPDLLGQLIADADTAMYAAKRAGGNRVHPVPDT